MKNWRDFIFPTLIALCALSVSGSAAFYSVTGLSKLFAGASLQVIIMAGSLEVSKLVIASLLYRYWKDLNKALKYYLTLAAGILVLITSIGIYGFLSAAYQETANTSSIVDTRIAFLEQKKSFFQDDVDRYDVELERISSNISTLSQARARDIQVRDTSSATGFRSTISTAELRIAQERIDTEESNRKDVQTKRASAADSLQKYQILILEETINNETAAELGPLKYISGLSGWPMDRIVNILLLVIVFVFDPLAISLVIAANFAFNKVNQEKKDNIRKNWVDEFDNPEPYEEDTFPDINDLEDKFNSLTKDDKEDWKVILDDHPDDEVEDSDVQDKEVSKEKPLYKKVERIIQKTPSKRRVMFTDKSEGWIDKGDEDRIIYM